jgi:hypothetical protein
MGHFGVTFTLVYRAATAGQLLTVRWTQKGGNGQSDLSLQSAVLK